MTAHFQNFPEKPEVSASPRDAGRGTGSEPLAIGSLFSGIGGLELGLERGIGNGAHTVFQVEQNAYCRAVLAKHWPAALRFDDVRTVGAHNLPWVNVLCGGYPCQPFSTAGHRLARNDPRHLWPEYARVIDELRPDYAVLENVANHLALGFGDVLGDLADLGYDAEWRVLFASDAGSPQRRSRLFALAYPRGHRVQGFLPRVSPSSAWPTGLSGSRRADFVRQLADAPFERGDSWPQPLVRCLDDGFQLGLAKQRVHALGNAVVPQVAEVVGRLIAQRETERLAGAA